MLKDSKLLGDLSECPREEQLLLHTNGESLAYCHIADIKFMPLQAYHNPNSLVNILSLNYVMNTPGCKVGMVSDPELAFLVSLRGKTICFTIGRDSLFYCKAGDLESLESSNNNVLYYFMNVLQGQGITYLSNADNEYSKKEKHLAVAARYLQEIYCGNHIRQCLHI